MFYRKNYIDFLTRRWNSLFHSNDLDMLESMLEMALLNVRNSKTAYNGKINTELVCMSTMGFVEQMHNINTFVTEKLEEPINYEWKRFAEYVNRQEPEKDQDQDEF